MNEYINPAAAAAAEVSGPLTLFGVWVRTLAVGVALVLMGIGTLLDGEVERVTAVVMLVGGLALAILSWHRARRLLPEIDERGREVAAASHAGTVSVHPTRARVIA
jgi:hypothetical protein